MKFTLSRPCKRCPFRTDIEPFLYRVRAEEIIEAIVARDGTFACHEMLDYGENEEGHSITVQSENSQHCAGALILLEKIEQPNQMMRVAERIGAYDRTKLHMDAPVFEDEHEFIDAQRE